MEVRSIVYFWWRKSEQSTGIIKFGDHTEPMINSDWYRDTEKYIQQTAAPREKNTFKELIGYYILDITDYAKSVNRNYKFAKVDNYVIDKIGFSKYRIGNTDQFRLPKYEYDFEEFIQIVKDLTLLKPRLELQITQEELDDLKSSHRKEFDFSRVDKALTVMSMIEHLGKRALIITDDAHLYEKQMDSYINFEHFKLYKDIPNDLMFMYLSSITIIPPKETLEILSKYDVVFIDNGNVEVILPDTKLNN